MRFLTATNAYQRSATYRNPRRQEAELFLAVNATLRNSQGIDDLTATKALADNELLWITLMDIVRDPSNRLASQTKALIISIGHTARREMKKKTPDINFLLGLNEQIAAGLTGT